MNNQNLTPFKKGETRGGYRVGAGRKPDIFKAKCLEMVTSPKFFSWAKDVFDGKDVEPHVSDGQITISPAGVSSRTYLWKTLAEYGVGKPASILEIPADSSSKLLIVLQP